MSKVVQERITPRIEEIVSGSQAGSRQGRSNVQQISTLRIFNGKQGIQEKGSTKISEKFR